MPSMGADMEEGTIIRWLKPVGAVIAKGDKIAEIETDKTTMEIEAYQEGVLRKIIVQEDETVPVGAPIALIGASDEELPEGLPEPTSQPDSIPALQPEPAPGSRPTTTESPPPSPQPQTVAGSLQPVKSSPIARRRAKELGIDISQVVSSGPDGRIVLKDVENFTPSGIGLNTLAKATSASNVSASTPTVPSSETTSNLGQSLKADAHTLDAAEIPLSSMRRAIARVTVKSKSATPHFYVTRNVDMSVAVEFRRMINATLADGGGNDKISINDMVLKATAASILKYPKWNSRYENDSLKGNENINLGVAIALKEGLIVPAIFAAQNMSLVEISRAAKDLVRRAKGSSEESLTQAELTSGTFSTSNLGMFGIDSFSAIIVPPQAAILAISAVIPTPVVRDRSVVVCDMMNLVLSVDHRVNDGSEAAVFINEIKRNLENPIRLLN